MNAINLRFDLVRQGLKLQIAVDSSPQHSAQLDLVRAHVLWLQVAMDDAHGGHLSRLFAVGTR